LFSKTLIYEPSTKYGTQPNRINEKLYIYILSLEIRRDGKNCFSAEKMEALSDCLLPYNFIKNPNPICCQTGLPKNFPIFYRIHIYTTLEQIHYPDFKYDVNQLI
jgi:hypothetical protein